MTELSTWKQITLSESPSSQCKYQKVLDMEKEAEEEQGRDTYIYDTTAQDLKMQEGAISQECW